MNESSNLFSGMKVYNVHLVLYMGAHGEVPLC